MPELRSSFESLGLDDVVTYVQSGNVVFRSAQARDDLRAVLEREIETKFGVEVDVVLRTDAELAAVTSRNPWLDQETQHAKLHAVFLDAVPDKAAVAGLDPDRSPPDRFAVDGAEIFVHYPNGSGRSKLSLDYFERRLGVRGTARNWNTVSKLLELTRR